MKKRMTKAQKRERLAFLVSLLVITILLCIPFINNIFIGIFGYAVYAYLVALYGITFFLLKGYRIALPKRKIAIYLSIFFCILITLHIGLTKEFALGGFGSYIFETYLHQTPGGMLISIISAAIITPFGYTAALVTFFLLTSLLILIAVFPLLIKKDNELSNKKEQASKQKMLERLSKNKKEEKNENAELKVMEIKEEKEKIPLTVEDYDVPPAPKTKEDARKMLFGDKPKPVEITKSKRYSVEELKFKKEKDKTAKKENPYEILPNVDASIIKPKDEWYTNSFMQNKKTKAKEVLLNTTLEEDYNSRYGISEKENKTNEEEREPFEIKPYEPAVQDDLENNIPIENVHEETFPIDYSQKEKDDNDLSKTNESSFREKELRKANTLHINNEVATNKPQNQLKNKSYICPHAGLLKKYSVEGFVPDLTEEEYIKGKEVLERTLEDFGITATVFNAIKGPTVTRFELRLAQGSGNSVNKVLNLQKDLRMVLEAEGEINILAPIKGKNAIGIEIPNKKRGIVSLRETICTQEFQGNKKGIKLALGKTLEGRPYVGDLEDMPHLLVAGATGTGKSVCINTIITSILFQHSPEEVKLLLIDPKKVELINYVGLPHLLIKEPLVEIPEIVKALKWIREETSQRFNKFRDMRVVNINAYNSYAKDNNLETIPKIVIVIDEASELMTKAKKEVEETLSSLARIGRAAGIHLIFATQSPTKDVITSEIQNNLNTKIAFAVSDYVHSQVIFKAPGAEKLLGKGDMYLKGSGGDLTRIQCSYIDPEEIQDIVSFILQNNEADFDENINEEIFKNDEPQQNGFTDNRIKQVNDTFMQNVKEALKIGLTMKRISTSMLQRKMEKGYNGAAKIIDYLEEKGYIGTPDSANRKREILITLEEFLEMFPEEKEDMLGME